MWQSANENKLTPLDAVNTQAVENSIYKTVSRYEGKENTYSAKDWYISIFYAGTAGQVTPWERNENLLTGVFSCIHHHKMLVTFFI
jgi:hypothetical protein